MSLARGDTMKKLIVLITLSFNLFSANSFAFENCVISTNNEQAQIYLSQEGFHVVTEVESADVKLNLEKGSEIVNIKSKDSFFCVSGYTVRTYQNYLKVTLTADNITIFGEVERGPKFNDRDGLCGDNRESFRLKSNHYPNLSKKTLKKIAKSLKKRDCSR
jgi:hypothetical protein